MNETAPDVIWYDPTMRWLHPAMPRPEQLPVVEYVRADLVRADEARRAREAAKSAQGDLLEGDSDRLARP